jgi:hypothetical protein
MHVQANGFRDIKRLKLPLLDSRLDGIENSCTKIN